MAGINKLTGITWLTTYNCNLNCGHCFFDTQAQSKYMDPDLVDRVYKSYTPDKFMFWQHLSGGEIFLNPDLLFKIIDRIQHYFKKDIGISTNGFWAKVDDYTKEILKGLKQRGITGLAVSADYFHEESMSMENPKRLIRLLKDKGMNSHSYIIGVKVDDGVEQASTINKSFELNTKELRKQGEFPLAPTTIRSIGKGSLINKPKLAGIPSGKCIELCTCLGEKTPFNPAMVWIDAYGNVMICYGITIGNLYKNSFDDIIKSYSSNANPVLKELANNGPKGLYNLAKHKGLSLQDNYYDACDLCYQVRSKLADSYPDILSPAECYPV